MKILYPGTFDPITNGHVDIVERATRIFDEVLVAIAANSKKGPAFSLAERMSFAKKALAKFQNVRVIELDGLLINFARKNGIHVVLRGLRAISDFEYEFQLAGMNRVMAPEVETVFMMPADKYAYISSSMVREIAELGGDVSQFVPPEVDVALKKIVKNEK